MKLACLDAETYLIAGGKMFPRIVLGATRSETDTGTVRVREDLLDWLEDTLADRDTLLVNQSIAFDLGCAIAERPSMAELVFDAYADNRVGCTHMLTQLYDIGVYGTNKGGTQRLDATGRRAPVDKVFVLDDQPVVKLPKYYGLQAQAKRWLGVELVKDETRTTYADFDGVPVSDLPDAQIRYVLGDLCALDLWRKVWASAEDIDLHNVFALSRRDFALRLNESRGRYTDAAQVQRVRDKWEPVLEETKQELLDKGFLVPEEGAKTRRKIHVGWTKSKHAASVLLENGLLPVTSLKKSDHKASDDTAKRFVSDYHSNKNPELCTEHNRRFFQWSGLWQEKTRVEYGKRVLTGRLVLKKDPVQQYAKEVAEKTEARLALTPTGQIKMNPDNAATCEDDLFDSIVRYSRSDAIRTYIAKLEAGVHAPLHMRQNGLAETGRTTSGGGESGINDQNHRREYGFRECWIPRHGYIFASVDYSQIELCALAQIQYWLFGSSVMGDAINAGQDFHVVFAAICMGITYEEAMRLKAEGDPRLKMMRNLAKAFNFGRPGGLAELSFIAWAKATYGVGIKYSEWAVEPREGYVRIPEEHLPATVWTQRIPKELAEAAGNEPPYTGPDGRKRETVFVVGTDPEGWQRVSMRWLQRQGSGSVYCKEQTYGHLNSQWLTLAPEMLQYLTYVQEKVRSGGGLIVQHVSNRTRASCTFPQAANSLFQGLVADAAPEALFRCWRAALTDPTSPLWGSGFVWFVHDELGLEARAERLHEAAYETSRIMVETMKEFIPDVLIEAEPAACRRWTKSADAPRLGVDGRLIPEEDWRIAHGRLSDEERDDVLDLFRRYRLKKMY